MVGLLFEDEPVLGIVSFPMLNEIVYAVKDLRTYWFQPFKKNAIKCKAKTRTLDRTLICCTDIKFFIGQYKHLLNLLESQSTNIRTWGDSYGYILVATGRAEFMIDPAPLLKIWDIVPIKIIAEEAGIIFDVGSNLRFATGAIMTSDPNLDKIAIDHLKSSNITTLVLSNVVIVYLHSVRN